MIAAFDEKIKLLREQNETLETLGRTIFIDEFNSVMNPIVEKIKNNTAQVQTLTKTRDTLLPKLMSGKIRVKI